MSVQVLSLDEWRRIDAACDSFESAWRQKTRTAIEEHLGQVEPRVRPALTSELVRIELEWRLKLGERPSAEEYAGRFPQLADDTGEWLAVAQAVVEARDAYRVFETVAPGDSLVTLPPQAELPSQDSASPRVLRQLGEYDLLECIGAGGMGEVWKARHRRLGKLVALKLILPGRAHAPAAVDRFVREMKALGQLDHPNLVEASDAGEIDGTIYLVMKLIEGHDLDKYVKGRGPLDIAEACGLARQVALGLQYLHERGLVHRDLKPGNVMRTPEGTVKILDLGLARWQAKDTTEGGTRTGEGMGTPDYMAPEQIAHAATVDIRADLYALGGTLFHLLTGRAPFGDIEGIYAKMKAQEMTPAPDVRTLRADVPAHVAALVAWLLAKRPADRPATPIEVADALKAMAVKDSLPLPIPPRPRRRVWITAGVVALLAGVALTVAFALPKPPGVDVVPQEPPGVLGKPTVLRFDVTHTERKGDNAGKRERMGFGSFSARLRDRATVSVTLSYPAYGYLIAYAPNGKEYLLDPADEKQSPQESAKLQYPPVGVRDEYALDDGVGLHVFLTVVSKEPLPSYAEWKNKHGIAPWTKTAGGEGTVWRKTEGDLHAATETDPDVRGPGAAALGVAPVERLLKWWQDRPGVDEVGLTGFAVTEAK